MDSNKNLFSPNESEFNFKTPNKTFTPFKHTKNENQGGWFWGAEINSNAEFLGFGFGVDGVTRGGEGEGKLSKGFNEFLSKENPFDNLPPPPETPSSPNSKFKDDVNSPQNSDNLSAKKNKGRKYSTGRKKQSSPIINFQDNLNEVSDNKPFSNNNPTNILYDAVYFKKVGKTHYEKEEYHEALDAFSKCLQICPPEWTEIAGVLGNRAATYMMLDRYVEVIEDCDRALKLMPNMLRLVDRKGRAQLKLGQLQEAENTFKIVLGSCLENSSDRSKNEENTIREAESGIQLKLEATAILSKLEAWSTFDFNFFLELTEQLLLICPQMRSAHSYKTFALCKLSRWEEAKSYAESVIFQFEKNSSAACRLDIIVSHQNTIECEPSSFVHIMSLMGPVLARNYMCAIKNIDACRNVLAIESAIDAIVQVLKGLGMLLSSSENWSWLAQALQSTEILCNIVIKANEKFRCGEYQEAIILYSEAIKIDPDACLWNAILYCNRAAANMNLGKYNDAINDCNLSWGCDVHNQLCLLLRARSWRAIKQTLFSIRDYRKYLSKKFILSSSSSSSEKNDSEEIGRELDDFIETECEKILTNEGWNSSSTSSACDENVSIEKLQEVHFILICFFFKISF